MSDTPTPIPVSFPTPTLPLEKELLPLFTEQLPVWWREVIVKYSPYVMMALAPLSIFAIGLGAFASIFSLLKINFLLHFR